MVSSTGFLQQIMFLTNESMNKLNNIGANLRANGKIQKSGRRYGAHDIGAKEAAIMLIAFLGADRAQDASRVVDQLIDMPIVYGNFGKTGINADPLPNTFGEVIEKLLTDELFSNNLYTVQVSRTYPKAIITWNHDGVDVPIEFELPTNDISFKLKENFRTDVVLNGKSIRYLLKQIACEGARFTEDENPKKPIKKNK